MKKSTISLIVAAVILTPTSVTAQLNPVPLIPTTPAPTTNINGTVEVEESGGYRGTFQNTGINLASAMRVRDGLIVRVKRMVKPGDDTAKEIIGNIPVASTIANVFTLGLFKRALRPTGANMRTTWMALNCANKTFDVASDGYQWQDIYNDAYGQAEELYFQACEPPSNPPYTQLPSADAVTIGKTGIKTIQVFPPGIAIEIEKQQREAEEANLCDRRIRKYNCSWSAYLEANPTVKEWAEKNLQQAAEQKSKLKAND